MPNPVMLKDFFFQFGALGFLLEVHGELRGFRIKPGPPLYKACTPGLRATSYPMDVILIFLYKTFKRLPVHFCITDKLESICGWDIGAISFTIRTCFLLNKRNTN